MLDSPDQIVSQCEGHTVYRLVQGAASGGRSEASS